MRYVLIGSISPSPIHNADTCSLPPGPRLVPHVQQTSRRRSHAHHEQCRRVDKANERTCLRWGWKRQGQWKKVTTPLLRNVTLTGSLNLTGRPDTHCCSNYQPDCKGNQYSSTRSNHRAVHAVLLIVDSKWYRMFPVSCICSVGA